MKVTKAVFFLVIYADNFRFNCIDIMQSFTVLIEHTGKEPDRVSAGNARGAFDMLRTYKRARRAGESEDIAELI